jgi:hypothetical protein
MTKTPAEARKILAGKKYRDTEVDAPLNGPLSRVGKGIRSGFRRIGDFFDAIVPGGPIIQNLLLAVLVVAAAVLLVRYVLRLQSKRTLRAQTKAEPAVPLGHWDKLADEAHAMGDYRTAIVYRFRGGISRLEHGPQPAAARLTNGVLASQAPATFPPLGTTFDAVRYGSEEGTVTAADASKQQWPNVVAEIRHATSTPKGRDRKAPREKKSQ